MFCLNKNLKKVKSKIETVDNYISNLTEEVQESWRRIHRLKREVKDNEDKTNRLQARIEGVIDDIVICDECGVLVYKELINRAPGEYNEMQEVWETLDLCNECYEKRENEETKTCTKCERELPLSEFHKNRATKDGLQSWCKDCFRKRANKQK
jgi:hypothetical protein